MKKIRDISIQKKISWLFLGCFLVLLICIILVLHDVYQKQMYKELIQRGHYEDEMIVHQMERLSQNVISCSNNIIINLNLSIGSREGLVGKPEKYDQRIKEKILAVMDNNFLLFPDISEIFILYDNGELYSKEKNRYFSYAQGKTRLVEEFEATDVDTLGMWYYRKEETPITYYLKVFRDTRGNNRIGYILLKLNEEIIYKSYRNQKAENPSDIYVFDENHMLLSSNQRDLVERVYVETQGEERRLASEGIYREVMEKKSGKDSFYVKEYKTSMGWSVVSVLDIKAGMAGLQVITWNIMLVSVVLMILFFFFTLAILKKIMRPVVSLAGHMRKTGVNLIQKIDEPNCQDEVGLLISSFNQMVDMNGKLIQRVAQDEEEKKQLELALLQMQIKPHFLYNTLDTAFCLNSMQMHSEASHVIKQLAGYYRLVLNHGNEWISFSEELDALEKYLDIQSVRYSEVISYSVSVDEELYEFQIPKMTLQPLVENAIYHGIKPSGRKGHILIMGELYQDEVTISVTDDGVGMSPKMFGEILSGEQESTDRESFGVKSVVERLRLFYGEGTKVELSPMAMGTSIVLTINLRKDDKN